MKGREKHPARTVSLNLTVSVTCNRRLLQFKAHRFGELLARHGEDSLQHWDHPWTTGEWAVHAQPPRPRSRTASKGATVRARHAREHSSFRTGLLTTNGSKVAPTDQRRPRRKSPCLARRVQEVEESKKEPRMPEGQRHTLASRLILSHLQEVEEQAGVRPGEPFTFQMASCADATGASPRTVRRLLQRLQADGVLTYTPGRGKRSTSVTFLPDQEAATTKSARGGDHE